MVGGVGLGGIGGGCEGVASTAGPETDDDEVNAVVVASLLAVVLVDAYLATVVTRVVDDDGRRSALRVAPERAEAAAEDDLMI